MGFYKDGQWQPDANEIASGEYVRYPEMVNKELPLDPTPEMIEAGAQRLVQWEDGCMWPDSWDAQTVAQARKEADKVWRSMWVAAQGPNAGDNPTAVRPVGLIE